jgi:hypothetical protein
LLATKFCARESRATDLRLSHGWEDIVYVLEERASTVAEVASAADDVRDYIARQCAAVLAQANVEELLEAVMGRDTSADTLVHILKQLAAPGSQPDNLSRTPLTQ